MSTPKHIFIHAHKDIYIKYLKVYSCMYIFTFINFYAFLSAKLLDVNTKKHLNKSIEAIVIT